MNHVGPFGLPLKTGVTFLSSHDWEQIVLLIQSKIWKNSHPVLERDMTDPLLSHDPGYGAFLLGFDFHITPQGPRLIEINTNAGGFMTAVHLSPCPIEKEFLLKHLIKALKDEYAQAQLNRPLTNAVIVDDTITTQPLFSEMKAMAEVFLHHGIQTAWASPEELTWESPYLLYKKIPVDLIYNRLTDFRLVHPAHQALRQAAQKKAICLTPHPAAYVRIADKRNFLNLKHPLIPRTHLLSEKNLNDWMTTKKDYVFKPPEGAGSKGVYRGDKISLSKLKTLPADTLVQDYIPPATSHDGTKYDLRVYTHNTTLLGCVARHFSGQVMEMRSELAGFRRTLVEGECCQNHMIFMNCLQKGHINYPCRSCYFVTK